MNDPETCTHGIVFDDAAARKLPPNEVRKRWPRGYFTKDAPCKECGYVGIYYASYPHYLSGDW